MNSVKRKRSTKEYDAARQDRQRKRWLAFVLVLFSLLFAGYLLLKTTTHQTKTQVATGNPVVVKRPPSPPNLREKNKEKARQVSRKQITDSPPLPDPARSCDDLRVLVDQNHPLRYNYVPADLISLNAYGVPVLEGDPLMRREAAVHLKALVAAAAADNEELVVASAYRSYADQQASYGKWTDFYGQGAGGMSARPGYSQHQLGTAVDFTNAEAGYKLWQPFGETNASAWLKNNAPKYGYVLSYPEGKYQETGYHWEPWHYRYIGMANVKRMEQSDLSLQALLVKEGVLPLC